MKRFLLTLQTCILWTWGQAVAMPAYPKPIPIVVEGDTLYIRLFGDEHCKRAETSDGYTVVESNGQWFYAVRDSDGCLIPSVHKLSALTDEPTHRFLSIMPKHLSWSAAAKTKHELHRVKARANTRKLPPVQGARRALVILMEYKDLKFVKSNHDFDRLFNERNYSEDGARGSVADFYTDVSYGQLQLTSDIIGPFTSRYVMSYYGGNDRHGNDNNPEKLFEEALEYASNEVSLADYDADGDGYVDNIHIIFAGHGEEAQASANAIWSHELTFLRPYTIQGMKIDRYSCAPELRDSRGNGISRIGPHCHEIGHALGAMDYYDTNYTSGGEFEGTGVWDVMASGSWNEEGIAPADFNPYVKVNDYGWITPRELPIGETLIHPSADDAESYYLLQSADAKDYFLLENRSHDKWGAGLPGAGLLIFHVHASVDASGNEINTSAPQRCYVVCASSNYQRPGNTPASYGDVNSAGCPFPGTSHNHNFGPNSTPRAFYWDTDACNIDLRQIEQDTDGYIRLTRSGNASFDDGTTRISLFEEGFETSPTQINVENSNGISKQPLWHVEQNPSAMSKFNDKLTAHSGTKSLQLSASKYQAPVESAFTFDFKQPTNGYPLRISFFATTLNASQAAPNIVRIGYQTQPDGEWIYVESSHAANNRWNETLIDMPAQICTQIRVEGVANAGSVLAIDDIKMEQIQTEESTMLQPIEKSSRRMEVYSASGIGLPSVSRGLNIVRDEHGNMHKVIIR